MKMNEMFQWLKEKALVSLKQRDTTIYLLYHKKR